MTPDPLSLPGTYHYLNNVLNRPASLSGVDLNAALLKRSSDACAELGVEGVTFTACAILDYRYVDTRAFSAASHRIKGLLTFQVPWLTNRTA